MILAEDVHLHHLKTPAGHEAMRRYLYDFLSILSVFFSELKGPRALHLLSSFVLMELGLGLYEHTSLQEPLELLVVPENHRVMLLVALHGRGHFLLVR
jgi:hypothetical protein